MRNESESVSKSRKKRQKKFFLNSMLIFSVVVVSSICFLSNGIDLNAFKSDTAQTNNEVANNRVSIDSGNNDTNINMTPGKIIPESNEIGSIENATTDNNLSNTTNETNINLENETPNLENDIESTTGTDLENLPNENNTSEIVEDVEDTEKEELPREIDKVDNSFEDVDLRKLENEKRAEINAYIESLKGNNPAQNFSTKLNVARNSEIASETEIKNEFGSVESNTTYFHAKANYGIDDMYLWGFDGNLIYPGAMLSLGYEDNQSIFKPIRTDLRTPINLASNLESVAKGEYITETVDNVCLGDIKKATNSIVKGFSTDDAKLPANISYEIKELKSNAELQVALGLSANINVPGLSALVDSHFSVNANNNKNLVMIKLNQIFYKIYAEPQQKNGSSSFFNTTDMGEVKSVLNADGVPVYVSSVSYGRTVVITLETEKSVDEVQARFNASLKSVSSSIASGSLYTDDKLLFDDEETRASYFIYGGSLDQMEIFRANSLSEILKILNKPTTGIDLVGLPVSYKLSYLDGTGAKIGYARDFYYTHKYLNLVTNGYSEYSGLKDNKNLEITDDENFKNEYSFSTHLLAESLMEKGYTKIKVVLNLDMAEIDDGYQLKRIRLGNQEFISKDDFGGKGAHKEFQTIAIEYEFDLDKASKVFSGNNPIKICVSFGAEGFSKDNWLIRRMGIEFEAIK